MAAFLAGLPRNVGLLTAAQALGASGPPIIISLGGLVGGMLADNKVLSTLPVSLYTIGVAAATVPLALATRGLGRRGVYLLGLVASAAAGLLAAYAIIHGSFALFCLSTLLAGINGACVQSYRFAAADSVGAGLRARTISTVMLGGLAAAVIGPQIVIWTRDLVPGISFAGSFLGLSVLPLLSLPLILMLRPPPLPADGLAAQPGRPLREIVRDPRFLMSAGAGAISYAAMSLVMTAAPIAMVGCGHTIGEAALGIQWHVLSMFAPSFVTGRLIERFGDGRITALGLMLIAAAALVALSGLGLAHFWISLILLGVGWNFGFIGATTMLTKCHRVEERAKVQGFNDFLVFGSVALASLSSGGIVQAAGWSVLNWTVLPIIGVALLMLALVHRRLGAVPARSQG